MTVTGCPTCTGWLAGVTVRLPAATFASVQMCAGTSTVAEVAANRSTYRSYVPAGGSGMLISSSAVGPPLFATRSAVPAA